MSTKRSRGRPQGTGKDDIPYLTQVADFILADPNLKPTTAMKRVLAVGHPWAETDETLLRRWQAKWKVSGGSLLASAIERAAAKASREGSGYTAIQRYGKIGHIGFQETSAMKMMRLIDESPTMKLLRSIEESPAMKVMRDMQKLQDMIDPPFMRHMRAQERVQRAMLDVIDPPYLRALKRLS